MDADDDSEPAPGWHRLASVSRPDGFQIIAMRISEEVHQRIGGATDGSL